MKLLIYSLLLTSSAVYSDESKNEDMSKNKREIVESYINPAFPAATGHGEHGFNGAIDLGLGTNTGSLGHVTLTKQVAVPYPQPVPVPVEKALPYPVNVPVAIRVDKPYFLHVPKPYPVPIDRPIPYQVDKPLPIQVNVPYKVPIPIQVPFPISKPYPIRINKPVPVHIPEINIVRKPVPVYIPASVLHGRLGNEQLGRFIGGHQLFAHGVRL